MPKLVWKDERDEERTFSLQATATIGRSAENDLVLRDTLVSRKHCSIEKRGEEWWLVDHNSRYGTYANDERVTAERKLSAGDRLRVGNVPMRFSASESGVSPAAPSSELSTTGPGTKSTARVVSATSRVVSARDLAARLARDLANPSIPGSSLAPLAAELEVRMTAAEKALEDLERDKLLGQTLGTVGHLMSLVTDVDTVLNMTLDQAVRVLGADRGFVLLRGEDGKLAPRVQRNMGSLRGISTSIAEQVAESGSWVLTTDAQVDPRFKEAASVMVHGIRSVMCVPLRASDQKIFGAIFVDGNPGNPMFGAEGVDFLQSFASQAAFAIERAQLATRHKQEEQHRQRLSSFFSPAVIDELLRGDESEALGGKSREITVLFTDIRGFTTLLERLSPAEAVEMLNDYFTLLVDDLLEEDATLDKFTGDGIMAFFGAPKEQPDHAIRAVRAAMKMQSRMGPLLERWQVEKRSFAEATRGLATGIGVHTGEAVVGRIGSPRKKDYTAIGDTVNVAARVQGVAAGGEVLITGATLSRIKAKVRVEAIEPVALKGKSRAVEIYRVLSML